MGRVIKKGIRTVRQRHECMGCGAGVGKGERAFFQTSVVYNTICTVYWHRWCEVNWEEVCD